MRMENNIAIVGCGAIAQKHVNAMKALGFAPKAGADVSSQACEKFGRENNVPVFAGVKEMIKSVKPKGGIICTPPKFRIDIIEQCLSNNIFVLAEKPLADNLPNAQKI